MTRLRGPLSAAALCLAVLAVRAYENRGVVYDRFHLPAFDGHVYAAMAEEPAVFTVAPWGYRLLAPALVSVSPWNAARGFAVLTPAALFAAALAAYAALRRLGHGELAAALAAAAFLASPPTAQILRYTLLAEPTTLALLALFLYALAAGAPWPVVALVGVLGTASKEFFVLLLPAYALSRRRAGRTRAALEAAAVLAPSVVLTLLLRFWWTPYLSAPPAGLPPPAVLADRLRQWALVQPGASATLGLLAALAVLGARRAGPGGWRAAFASVAAVAFAAPFLNPSDFSVADLARLHVYVLLPLAPFVLCALRPARDGGAAPVAVPRAASALALAAAAAVALAPVALLDRYRRLDLRADGDADRVLAFVRGTRAASMRVASGETFEQTALRAPADDAPGSRLRWYARDGWQPASGAAVAAGPLAVVVVPVRARRALDVVLALGPPVPDLAVSMGGRPLTAAWTDDGLRVTVPRDALVRGDNALALTRPPGGPPFELRRLTLVPRP